MARGNSKLGGRGRGREVAEETGPLTAWVTDGTTTPAAPSPARNILPGEPFEPVSAAFPAQRNPEPAPFPATAPAGWGFAPMPGMPGAIPGVPGVAGLPGMPGLPGAAPEPGRFHGDAATLTWPNEESTGPMPAVPAAGPDPLDALQQYAGLPLGAAPAPDPTQLYQSSHLANASALGGEGTATQTLPAPPAADSGFADGGIFTGGEPFDGVPAAQTFAAPAVGLPGAFGSQVPTAGYVPQSTFDPLDVTSGPAGGLDDGLPGGEPESESRGGRRRAGSRRRDAAKADASDSAPRHGAKRAVALLGAVAVLGGAGYVGYSQLAGTDEPTALAPTHAAQPAVTTHYALPSQLANLVQITPAQTKALTASYIQLAAKTSPNLPAAQTATAYHPQNSAPTTVNVVVFRPGSTSTYDALLGSLSRPAAGSASVAAIPVAPGAAGGTMMCGSSHGAAITAWCAWNSPKGMGFVQAKGTANTAFPAVYTRELRAFAER